MEACHPGDQGDYSIRCVHHGKSGQGSRKAHVCSRTLLRPARPSLPQGVELPTVLQFAIHVGLIFLWTAGDIVHVDQNTPEQKAPHQVNLRRQPKDPSGHRHFQ